MRVIHSNFLMAGKFISFFVGIGYLILAFYTGGMEFAFRAVFYVFFCLIIIWFGHDVSRYLGFSGLGQPHITRESHGGAVVFMGWVILLLPAIIFGFIFLSRII